MGKGATLKRIRLLIAAVILTAIAVVAYRYGRPIASNIERRITGGRTIDDVVRAYGPAADARLRPFFDRLAVYYPPQHVALLVFKREQRLELWAEKDGKWTHVRAWPVLAASGHPGPKLREGDRQVPEGLYRIVALNPNSAYHLSLRLDYPNGFDRENALVDGRRNLGGDIFIHGKAASIGCIAVGDDAIEELFILAARLRKSGPATIKVIIAPNDLRGGTPPLTHPANPAWTAELYDNLRRELAAFTPPPP